MKTSVAVLLLFMSSVIVFAGDDQIVVDRAARAAAILHDSTLDPASFVLDSVYVTKPNKKGEVDLCFAYRAYDRVGRYFQGVAVQRANGKLRTFILDELGLAKGYNHSNLNPLGPCSNKYLDRNITESVVKIAPKLYKTFAWSETKSPAAK